MEILWFFVIVIGPLAMAAVLAYVLLRRRRLSRSERVARDRATEHLYREEAD